MRKLKIVPNTISLTKTKTNHSYFLSMFYEIYKDYNMLYIMQILGIFINHFHVSDTDNQHIILELSIPYSYGSLYFSQVTSEEVGVLVNRIMHHKFDKEGIKFSIYYENDPTNRKSYEYWTKTDMDMIAHDINKTITENGVHASNEVMITRNADECLFYYYIEKYHDQRIDMKHTLHV